MRIFVSGSSSHLAQAVLPKLCAHPAIERVIGVDIRPTALRHDKLETRVMDVRDGRLGALLEGCDALVHLAFVVLRFNIQKVVIELATAFLGAGSIVGVFVLLFGGPAAQIMQNPVKFVLSNSPFWLIVFLVLGIAGFVLQYMHNRSWEVQTYNRMSEPTP